MRMSALGRSGSIGAGGGVPGRHGRPGTRSAAVETHSAFFSRGTMVKRRVWGCELLHYLDGYQVDHPAEIGRTVDFDVVREGAGDCTGARPNYDWLIRRNGAVAG